MNCPLCLAGGTRFFCADRRRPYHRCIRCDLVFVPPTHHLDPAAEKRRYDLHRNDPGDAGYRAFLERLARPLLARLPPGARGLDYGSGPQPVLSQMLAAAGHHMRQYDPYYAPHPRVLEERYDFLVCCETMEHFAAPAREWRRFLELVRPGGWLGVMTRLRDSAVPAARAGSGPSGATDSEGAAARAFLDWYYKNDPTHVAFYSRATFRYLARRDGLAHEFHGDSVILLRC